MELRERKIQEFINLDQGDMSIKDYSLKFTQLSKYAPSIVADSSAKMNKFVNGISDLVVNECRSSMLIPRMDISRLMVHVEQIEDQKLKQVGRELKKVRTEDGNSSKAKFKVQGKSSFKRRYSTKAFLMIQGSSRVRFLLPIPKRGKVEDLTLKSLFVRNMIRDMMVSA